MALLGLLCLLPPLAAGAGVVLLSSDPNNLLRIQIQNSKEPKEIALNDSTPEAPFISTDFDLREACSKTPYLLLRFQYVGEKSPAPLSIDRQLRMFYVWKCERKGNRNLQRKSYAPRRILWTPRNIIDSYVSATVEADQAGAEPAEGEAELIGRFTVSLSKRKRNLLRRN